MRINHNIASLNTYRQLTSNTASTSKSLEKLSSGLRINRAGDDAAGLAISEKMRGQIRGLDQASRNSQDAISLIQTAEGALNETHSILQRMRELAVQSSNDTNTSTDRNEIQKEVNQLTAEINRIADTTQFNTKVLMKGAYGTTASSASSASLAVVSSKADTITAGSYAVNVATLATKSTYAGAVDLGTTPATIVTNTNDTLVINNVTIKLNAGSTNNTSVINQINAYQDQTGIIASDNAGRVTLTNLSFGNKAITVSGNAETAIFGGETYTAGVNANIDTVGGTAVTVSADATDGRKLTINSGALKGIVLQANVLGAVSISVTKGALTMQIGANENQTFNMSLEDMGAISLGVDSIDVSSAANATASIKTIQSAIDAVSGERSKLGAYQNRLEHTINNLGTSSENLTAAESRVRDVDMAKEMMEFTKNNILSQAAQAMLAQANQQPQGVLQLLR
jgi:flagellin